MTSSTGTTLNPPAYKTFIPDQYKTGAQKDSIGKSSQSNFFEDSKISYVTNPLTQPIRTLDYIRDTILNSINGISA